MMISFHTSEAQKFNLRAVCLIIKDNYVLFQRFHQSDYWFLPGGRVEMMEETKEAIDREIQEEYGWKVKNKKLIWIVESFFKLEDTEFHELGFYYFVQIDDDIEVTDNDFSCLEEISANRWIHINELSKHPIVPQFIRQGIDVDQIMNSSEIQHIINRG